MVAIPVLEDPQAALPVTVDLLPLSYTAVAMKDTVRPMWVVGVVGWSNSPVIVRAATYKVVEFVTVPPLPV
jgi:hypothetical protein